MTLIVLLTLSLFQANSQGVDSNDRVSICYVMRPGGLITGDVRFFTFNSDSLFVMNKIGWTSDSKMLFDTTYYSISSIDKESILEILNSPDTLQSAINPCIMDGMILTVSYKKANERHTAWISNAFDDKIYNFIDIINKYVPDQFQIRYNKNELIKSATDCLSRIHKLQKS